MHKLSDLHNIGKILEEKLADIDIKSSEELINLGSKEAFLRLRIKDPKACFNTLCALEGAIQGIRWHDLTKERKEELQEFYRSIK